MPGSGEDHLRLGDGACGSREEQEAIRELQSPDPRVVAQYVVAVEPANPSFDDNPVLIEGRENVSYRIPEMAAKLLLQEPHELVAAANDVAGLNGLQLENDVGMDYVAQLLERVLPEQREVAPRQALALDDHWCAALGDTAKYAPHTCEPPTVEGQPAGRALMGLLTQPSLLMGNSHRSRYHRRLHQLGSKESLGRTVERSG